MCGVPSPPVSNSGDHDDLGTRPRTPSALSPSAHPLPTVSNCRDHDLAVVPQEGRVGCASLWNTHLAVVASHLGERGGEGMRGREERQRPQVRRSRPWWPWTPGHTRSPLMHSQGCQRLHVPAAGRTPPPSTSRKPSLPCQRTGHREASPGNQQPRPPEGAGRGSREGEGVCREGVRLKKGKRRVWVRS